MLPWTFSRKLKNVELEHELAFSATEAVKESGIRICNKPGKGKWLRRDRGLRFAVRLVRFAAS